MIGTINLILFSIAAWTLIVTPGPNMLYVVTRGISLGRKAGLLSAAGIVLGILIQAVLTSLGLAAVLHTSALAYQLVKFLGAGYLVYLGVRTIWARKEFSIEKLYEHEVDRKQIFFQGVLTSIFNPKLSLFFLTFLPQFITKDTANFALNIVLLGILYAIYVLLFLGLVGYFSGKIGSWINTHPGISKKIPLITGGILVGLGFRLAFMKRL